MIPPHPPYVYPLPTSGTFFSNDRSRGSATAVTVGAELLLRSEGTDMSGWIQASDWEEDSDVLRRHWYMF